MNNNLKTKIDFGKIDYNGTGKRYATDVTIELRTRGGEATFTIDPVTKKHIPTGKTTPTYTELAICGNIWNTFHTDIVQGGQCLDELYKHLSGNELFKEIYTFWKKYHLNGMNAGTPEQTAAVEEWKANGNKYDYTKVCEYLKSINLYEVPFYGKTIGKQYNGELYRYGCGWVINDLPGDVLIRIEHIINSNNAR